MKIGAYKTQRSILARSYVFAGYNDDEHGRRFTVQGSCLKACAKRGWLALRVSPDGNLAGVLTTEGYDLLCDVSLPKEPETMKLDPNSLTSRELRVALYKLVERYDRQWAATGAALPDERIRHFAKREFALDLIGVLESIDESI